MSSDTRVMGLSRGITFAQDAGLDERETRGTAMSVFAWAENQPNPWGGFMG